MADKKLVSDIKGIKDALDVDEFFSISDLKFLNLFKKINDYYIYENDKYKIAFLIQDNKIIQKTYLNNDLKPHREDGPANILFSKDGTISLEEFFINGENKQNYKPYKIIYEYFKKNNGEMQLSTLRYLYKSDNLSLTPNFIIYDFINKKILQITIIFNNKIIKINETNINKIYNDIYNKYQNLNDFSDISPLIDDLKILKMMLY